jgi:hypothetical protein
VQDNSANVEGSSRTVKPEEEEEEGGGGGGGGEGEG